MKINCNRLIIVIITLIISCCYSNAQKLNLKDGLNIIEFSVAEGDVYMFIPNKYVANDVLSGTIISKANGKSVNQVQKNSKKLENYEVQIGNVKSYLSNSIFSILGDENTKPILFKNKKGNIIQQEVSFEIVNKTSNFCFPKTLISENRSQISGIFDGNLLNTEILIGGEPIQIIAESTVQTFFQLPKLQSGPVEIVLKEEGIEYKGSAQVVTMEFNADKYKLSKGEGTNIHINISGIENIEEPIDLNLDNVSISTITMQGGNNQRITLYPGNQSSFSKTWRIQSLKSGVFNLIAELRVPETPILSNEIIIDSTEYDSDFIEISDDNEEDICEKYGEFKRPNTSLYDFGTKLTGRKKEIADLLKVAEEEFIKHLVECRNNWDINSAIEWQSERARLANVIITLEKKFILSFTGFGFNENEKKLLKEAHSNSRELENAIEEEQELFEEWQKLLESFDGMKHLYPYPDAVTRLTILNEQHKLLEAQKELDKKSMEVNKLRGIRIEGKEKAYKAQEERGFREMEKYGVKFNYTNPNGNYHTLSQLTSSSETIKDLLGDGKKIYDGENVRRGSVRRIIK